MFLAVLKFEESEYREKYYDDFVRFLIEEGYYNEKNANEIAMSYMAYMNNMDEYNETGFESQPSKYGPEGKK